jgi:hypothetical protein
MGPIRDRDQISEEIASKIKLA